MPCETRDGPNCGVPKLTLVSQLQALLHEGRKILPELVEAETLVRELQDFRVEFTAAGHLTFNARSGKHDDLVLALAIAVWRAHGGGMAQYGHFEWMRWRAMGPKAPEPRYYVGVDFGQSRQRSPWCAESIRQGPLRRIRHQSRSMGPARSSESSSSVKSRYGLARAFAAFDRDEPAARACEPSPFG